MFIGICGGICAGKKTVAQYLVDHHGFQRLYLDRPDGNPDPSLPPGPTEEAPDHTLVPPSPPSPTPATPAAPGPGSPSPPRVFATASLLLNFVTQNWQARWVTTDVHDERVLDLFGRRPFFILISVDAPVTVRWQRYRQRTAAASSSSPAASLDSLEAFIAHSDNHLYDQQTGLLPLITRATVRLLNTSSSLAHLYATLGNLNLASPERLRPSWDTYFMALASLAAHRSNCMKRRVGAVLVGRGRRVLSTGYNGTPRGLRNCADGGCGRCNDGGNGSGVALATCLCIHAEENALLEAGRERIREGSVLYCDTCPCLTCSIKICQVGIGEVVYGQGYSMDTETAAVFRQAGVKLRQFSPPPNGLIHLEKSNPAFDG